MGGPPNLTAAFRGFLHRKQFERQVLAADILAHCIALRHVHPAHSFEGLLGIQARRYRPEVHFEDDLLPRLENALDAVLESHQALLETRMDYGAARATCHHLRITLTPQRAEDILNALATEK